jgi:hypothetical protein
VTGSRPAWRTALGELPIVRGGRWAVGGSASLALHGLPVDPRDLDLLADHVAAAELVDGLRGAVVSDEASWDRGDVRAVRRAVAIVHGIEVEILESVEAVGPTGDVLVATPDLDHVDRITVSGRQIPVLALSTMRVLLDATGNRERAKLVANVLGEGGCHGASFTARSAAAIVGILRAYHGPADLDRSALQSARESIRFKRYVRPSAGNSRVPWPTTTG